MLSPILQHEWRMLRADRAMTVIVALLLSAMTYGAFNGARWVNFERDTLDAAQAEERERLRVTRIGVAEANAGRTKPAAFVDPRMPAAVGRSLGLRYAAMPPARASVLAIGQSDLYPSYFKVSTQSKQSFVNNDEIEHPLHLLSGKFDLAFVVLYLYPLIVLALTYNVISAEKEAGTLALALSQPVSLETLAAGKILLRFGLLMALTIAFGLMLAIFTGTPVLLWFLVVAAYGAFWFALALGVNALGGASATNAMGLAGLWLFFVLLVPSLLNVTVKWLHPVPSRVELIQATRVAGAEAAKRGSILLAKYLEDHPELAGPGVSVADAAVSALATQEEVERRVQPVLDRFEERLQRQQTLVDRYRYLSPAIVAQAALFDLAGTGPERYRHFQAIADSFHREWRGFFFPRIARKVKLTERDIETLPAFVFREEAESSMTRRVMGGVAAILAAAMALGLLGFYGLRRYAVQG